MCVYVHVYVCACMCSLECMHVPIIRIHFALSIFFFSFRYATHILVPRSILGATHILLLDPLVNTSPNTPSFSNFSHFVHIAEKHALQVYLSHSVCTCVCVCACVCACVCVCVCVCACVCMCVCVCVCVW